MGQEPKARPLDREPRVVGLHQRQRTQSAPTGRTYDRRPPAVHRRNKNACQGTSTYDPLPNAIDLRTSDNGLGRLNWAESSPTSVNSEGADPRQVVVPLRAPNRLHRPRGRSATAPDASEKWPVPLGYAQNLLSAIFAAQKGTCCPRVGPPSCLEIIAPVSAKVLSATPPSRRQLCRLPLIAYKHQSPRRGLWRQIRCRFGSWRAGHQSKLSRIALVQL